MNENDKPINFDYKKIKAKILNILIKLDQFYINLNQQLLFFWHRILSRQSENRLTNGLKILIENPATALLLNTILFSALGIIFGGLIERILFIISGLNILVFCIKILGWESKLDD